MSARAVDSLLESVCAADESSEKVGGASVVEGPSAEVEGWDVAVSPMGDEAPIDCASFTTSWAS